MTSRSRCPRCASDDVQDLPHASARCRSCLHTYRTDSVPPEVPVCARCGQTTIGAACDCAPEPARHEQDRLFQPPAEQMPGQTTISGLDPQ